MKYYLKILLLLLVLGGITVAQQGQAVTVRLGELSPQLVQERRADLLQRECKEVVTNDQLMLEVPAGVSQHVVPRDWQTGLYMFCPPGVAQTLTPVSGQVLAATTLNQLLNEPITPESCSFVNLVCQVRILAVRLGNFFFKILYTVVAWWAAVILGTAALAAVSVIQHVVTALLVGINFTRHPFVTNLFPFVLGVVNIGFVLVLLFSAFATVLRIETFDWKRILPRLIISILLVNFSLLIAAVLIDASRLLMAIGISVLGTDSIGNFGERLATGNQLFQKYLTAGGFGGVEQALFGFKIVKLNTAELDMRFFVGSTDLFIKVMMSLLMLLFVLIGLVILGVVLYMRAVMLILLLVTAPFAYLLMPIPKFQSYAVTWWTKFLKYTFIGPLMVFLLLLVTYAPLPDGNDNYFESLVKMLVAVGVWIGGSLAAVKMGGAAAEKTMNFMKKNAGLAAMGAIGVTGLALGAAGGVIGGAVGGAEGGALGRKIGRGFARAPLTARDTYTDAMAAYKKGKGKTEKKRQEESYGTAIGARFSESASQTKKRKEGEDFARLANASPNADPTGNLAASRLRNPIVGKLIKEEKMRLIISEAVGVAGNANAVTRTRHDAQLRAMISSKTIMKRMEPGDRDNLLNLIEDRLQNVVDPGERAELGRMLSEFNRTAREIEHDESASSKP